MCFSLDWVYHLCFFLIVIVFVFSVIKLLLPYLLQKLGADGTLIIQIVRLIMWLIIALFVLALVFDLLSCAINAGGSFSLWSPPRH